MKPNFVSKCLGNNYQKRNSKLNKHFLTRTFPKLISDFQLSSTVLT